jgi:hypothetical protein
MRIYLVKDWKKLSNSLMHQENSSVFSANLVLISQGFKKNQCAFISSRSETNGPEQEKKEIPLEKQC